MPLTTYRPRRDTKANWTAANPILKLGEVGYEFETTVGVGQAKMKTGTGTTAWNDLDYSIDDDITNKAIKSFEDISDENPVLSAGESIKRFASKVKKQITRLDTLLSNLSTLADGKISTSMIYTGLDSSNNSQVLAAPAGKQLKQLCDNNTSAISTLNSNFTSIEPKDLTRMGAFVGTITRNASMVSGKQVTLSLTITSPDKEIAADTPIFYVNGMLKNVIGFVTVGNFDTGYVFSSTNEVGDTIFYIRTKAGAIAVPVNTEIFIIAVGAFV